MNSEQHPAPAEASIWLQCLDLAIRSFHNPAETADISQRASFFFDACSAATKKESA